MQAGVALRPLEAGVLYAQADELERAAKTWVYVNGATRDVAGNLMDAAEALRKAARIIRRAA